MTSFSGLPDDSPDIQLPQNQDFCQSFVDNDYSFDFTYDGYYINCLFIGHKYWCLQSILVDSRYNLQKLEFVENGRRSRILVLPFDTNQYITTFRLCHLVKGLYVSDDIIEGLPQKEITDEKTSFCRSMTGFLRVNDLIISSHVLHNLYNILIAEKGLQNQHLCRRLASDRQAVGSRRNVIHRFGGLEESQTLCD